MRLIPHKELPHPVKDLYWLNRVCSQAFNQRRKTLRNALSGTIPKDKMDNHPFFDKRAEQLSVADFIALTQHLTMLVQS